MATTPTVPPVASVPGWAETLYPDDDRRKMVHCMTVYCNAPRDTQVNYEADPLVAALYEQGIVDFSYLKLLTMRVTSIVSTSLTSRNNTTTMEKTTKS